MQLKQFDIKTAFLYGELEDDIYMRQPTGFGDNSNRVCKLRKSLYGLKQASRCWNRTFTGFIEKFGFIVCQSDPCVFVSTRDGNTIILAIYVDDGLIAGSNDECIRDVISHLRGQFEMTIVNVGCFLGLEIERLADGSIFLHQSAYARKILQKFEMEECNAVATPSDPNQVLERVENAERLNYPYRELIGSLMYLAVGTRPDICYAVGKASRFLEHPSTIHVNAAKRILRYVKGTLNYGILYDSNGEKQFRGYSDADHAGDTDTRRSTTGYAFMLGNGIISWNSERQKSVAISTTESEYVAASNAVKELIWLKRLLAELMPDRDDDALFLMDCQSAIRLIKNPEYHKRTKHIDVRYHFVREKYDDGVFNLEYVPSEHQLADIFTKALPKGSFQYIRSSLGITSIE